MPIITRTRISIIFRSLPSALFSAAAALNAALPHTQSTGVIIGLDAAAATVSAVAFEGVELKILARGLRNAFLRSEHPN
jgi:hypothetical protein